MKSFLPFFLFIFALNCPVFSVEKKTAPFPKTQKKKKVRLPRSKINSPPPLQKIPPSFPDWWRPHFLELVLKEERKRAKLKQQRKEKKAREKKKRNRLRKINSVSEILFTGSARNPSSKIKSSHQNKTSELYLTSFLTEKPPKKVGNIVTPDSASVFNILFKGQHAYAKVTDPKAQINDVLHIFRSEKKGLFFTSRYITEIIGSIQLLTEVKNRMFRVKVIRALDPIYIGASLTYHPLRKIHILQDKTRRVTLQKSAKIFELPKKESNMLSKGSIVFLNRGRKDGLEEGQILAIHERTQTRKSNFISKTGPLIGSLQVLDVIKKFSTAIITETNQIVYLGDLVGLPYTHFSSQIQ